jgi:(2Fe-2S) ferredoxin
MSRYQRHIFICTNRREAGHPKGSCAEKGSEDLRQRFKIQIARKGLAAVVRVNAAGCLDACAHGPSIVVYPEGVWYGGVRIEDIDEIIDEHILGGRIVGRLLIRDERYTPASAVLPFLEIQEEKKSIQ